MSRLWFVLALLVVADSSLAQQRSIAASGNENVGVFRGQVGRRVTFACPSRVSMNASIWGTDVYTDDSPLCLAAVHAGVLERGQAGAVTLVIGGITNSFQASTRNGVTSQAYGSYTSMSFDESGAPGEIDWTTTAQGFPPELTDPVVVNCPARGSTAAGVWGTEQYSESSAICVAAVHAGVINATNGGLVAVTGVPDARAFTASTSGGVTSQAYPGSAAAFRVTAPGGASSVVAGGGSTGGAGGLTVTVDVATATVRWTAIPGASGYVVTRWKVGDPGCCNNLSPPGAPISGTQWVDTAPLPTAGTYGYRLYATTSSGVVAAETTLTWNGVETGAGRSVATSVETVAAGAGPAPAVITAETTVAALPAVMAQGMVNQTARYRVTVTGVQVTATTKDIFDNTDGVGDEISAVVAHILWEQGTNRVISRGAVRGIEYGDINALRKEADRIEAGNAAPGGGLVSRDVVPDGFAPGTSNRTPDARLFPLLVWEGELTDNVNALLVAPSLWERDVTRTSLDTYVDKWVQGGAAQTLEVAATQLPMPDVMIIQSLRSPGLPTAFAVADLAAHLIDRPLGLTLQPLISEYHDRFIVLTRNKLRALESPGQYMSLAIQYAEPLNDPVLGCDYTLELRIERLQ